MNDTIEIPENERETVHVFALDLPAADAEAFVEGGGEDNWPLKSVLGADTLRARHIEAFRASDLEGVGLADYLINGLGVDPEHIDPDRGKLDAANAHIVIIHAPAFDGEAQSLTTRPPLTHLGSYSQIQAEQRLVPLPGTAAEPVLPPTPAMAPAPLRAQKGGRLIWALFAAALVVLVIAYMLSGSAR